jgi:hypothetical protein
VASNSSTAVEIAPHHLNVKGSIPAVAAADETEKKVFDVDFILGRK